MEPAPELLMPLLPYQKQFLSWAIACEKGEVRGGVLADEMVRAWFLFSNTHVGGLHWQRSLAGPSPVRKGGPGSRAGR